MNTAAHNVAYYVMYEGLELEPRIRLSVDLFWSMTGILAVSRHQ